MKKRKTAILAICAVLFLSATILLVGQTYSRYVSSADGTGTADVAKWIVKVNATDITPATTTSFATLTLTPTANANVAAGKIAPGGKLTTSFDIDPTGAEVAMEYEVTIGTITASAGTVPTGFEVSKLTANGTELTPTGSTYSGTITLPATGPMTSSQAVAVEVEVTWTEDTDPTDTEVGVNAPTLTIPVTVTVKQKTA